MAEYIDREAAIRMLRGSAIEKYPLSFSSGILASADELEKLPAEDVVPRHKLQKESDLAVSDLTSALEAEKRKVRRLEEELRKAESERDYMRSRMAFFREIAENRMEKRTG